MIDLLIDRPCRTLDFVVKNTSKSFAVYSGGNSVPVSPTLRSVHSLHRIAPNPASDVSSPSTFGKISAMSRVIT
jgi:hypothetical protein